MADQLYYFLVNCREDLQKMLKRKVHLLINKLEILKTHTNILREMREVRKIMSKNVIEPMTAALDAEGVPRIAEAKNILVVVKRFSSEAENLSIKMEKAAEIITEDGAQWEGEVPEFHDLCQLSVQDRKRLVQHWEDGETFTLIWMSYFKAREEEWDSIRRQVEEEVQKHFKSAGIPNEECVVADQGT